MPEEWNKSNEPNKTEEKVKKHKTRRTLLIILCILVIAGFFIFGFSLCSFPFLYKERGIRATMVADARRAAEQEIIYHKINNAYMPLRRTIGINTVQLGAEKFSISKGNAITISVDGNGFTIVVDNPDSGKKHNPLLLKSDGTCKWKAGVGPDC